MIKCMKDGIDLFHFESICGLGDYPFLRLTKPDGPSYYKS